MIEDTLTRNERIRLEALNQAVQRYAMRPASNDEVLKTAQKYETWIRGDEESA